METAVVTHTLEPVFDSNSRVLILGTMPSPKSREAGFYYGHPQNRFWPVLAAVFATAVPQSTEERREFLLSHRIALWDVLQSCEISGASDSSIRNPVPNDFARIFSRADIREIFTTGTTAYRLFTRFGHRPCRLLPSPSPANCRNRFEDLVEAYRAIRNYVNIPERRPDNAL